jgi:hypothetical protein
LVLFTILVFIKLFRNKNNVQKWFHIMIFFIGKVRARLIWLLDLSVNSFHIFSTLYHC